MAGGLVPAWDSARTPIAPALRAGAEEDALKPLGRLAPGLLLIAAAGVLVWLPPVGGMSLAAYAAIGSMGTLFLAIAPFEPRASAAALYYLIHSTLAAGCLFLAVDLVAARRGDDALGPDRAPIAQGGLIGVLYFAAAVAVAAWT